MCSLENASFNLVDDYNRFSGGCKNISVAKHRVIRGRVTLGHFVSCVSFFDASHIFQANFTNQIGLLLAKMSVLSISFRDEFTYYLKVTQL